MSIRTMAPLALRSIDDSSQKTGYYIGENNYHHHFDVYLRHMRFRTIKVFFGVLIIRTIVYWVLC